MHARILKYCVLLSMASNIYGQSPTNEIFPEKFAGFSGDLGLVSNYLFRGISYSDDLPALQGGLDYEFSKGWEVGTWISSGSRELPLEINVFGGYNLLILEKTFLTLLGEVSYYPHVPDESTFETTLNFNYDFAGFNYHYDFVLEEHYIDAGLFVNLTNVIYATARYGINYSYKNNDGWLFDLGLKAGVRIKQAFRFDAMYVYHEQAGHNFSIALGVNFAPVGTLERIR